MWMSVYWIGTPSRKDGVFIENLIFVDKAQGLLGCLDIVQKLYPDVVLTLGDGGFICTEKSSGRDVAVIK